MDNLSRKLGSIGVLQGASRLHEWSEALIEPPLQFRFAGSPGHNHSGLVWESVS